MDNSFNILVSFEKIGNIRFYTKIESFKSRRSFCNIGNPFQNINGRIGKIINNNNLKTRVLEFNNGMGTNVAQTACYEYFFHIFSFATALFILEIALLLLLLHTLYILFLIFSHILLLLSQTQPFSEVH